MTVHELDYCITRLDVANIAVADDLFGLELLEWFPQWFINIMRSRLAGLRRGTAFQYA